MSRYEAYSSDILIELLEKQQAEQLAIIEEHREKASAFSIRNEEGEPETDITKWPVEMQAIRVSANLIDVFQKEKILASEIEEIFAKFEGIEISSNMADNEEISVDGIKFKDAVLLAEEFTNKIMPVLTEAFASLKAHQIIEQAQQIQKKAALLIADVQKLSDQHGIDTVYLDQVDFDSLTRLQNNISDDMNFLKLDIQQKNHQEIFGEAQLALHREDTFYLLYLEEFEDPEILKTIRKGMRQSYLAGQSLDWIDQHGTEIVLLRETERAAKFKSGTLAFVEDNENKLKVIIKPEMEQKNTVVVSGHEIRHIMQRILLPELDEAPRPDSNLDERAAVDAFIRMRFLEADAHAFHQLIAMELNDEKFIATPEQLLDNFGVMLDSPQIQYGYDSKYINLTIIKAFVDGRLPQLIRESKLVTVENIGKLLRFNEDEPDHLAALIGNRDDIKKQFLEIIVMKLSNIHIPAPLLTAYIQTQGDIDLAATVDTWVSREPKPMRPISNEPTAQVITPV